MTHVHKIQVTGLISLAFGGFFLFYGLSLPAAGFFLIATGATLNYVVVAANGGKMPTYPLKDGASMTPEEHRYIDASTKLRCLADIIVTPWGVHSLGDVLLHLSAINGWIRTHFTFPRSRL